MRLGRCLTSLWRALGVSEAARASFISMMELYCTMVIKANIKCNKTWIYSFMHAAESWSNELSWTGNALPTRHAHTQSQLKVYSNEWYTVNEYLHLNAVVVIVRTNFKFVFLNSVGVMKICVSSPVLISNNFKYVSSKEIWKKMFF